MKLTVVIPAYNEEDAVASTIERCLDARNEIIRGSAIEAVEIVVVSDGSTDRTAEIAGRYGDVRLIVFEKNRGYGAAIKRGFEEGTGDIVGFLDADGTCDPRFFATLCAALVDANADVAIGSRMGPQSRMPAVRRFGNRIYALILSALSNKVVQDTASGMRVIRREALRQLYPLPDGLHFTPAMSARVLMDDRLSIVECPMPYEERIGESKLHVGRDGVRFLRTIFEMSLMWRPAKLFVAGAAVCLGLMTLLAMHPIEMWVRLGRLDEDMLYRLLFCSFLGTFGVMLLSTGLICRRLHDLLDAGGARSGVAPRPGVMPKPGTFTWAILDRVYSLRGVGVMASVAIPLLIWLIGEGAATRILHGYVDLHWSRVVLAGLVAFGLGQMIVTVMVMNVLRFHTARQPLLITESAVPKDEALAGEGIAPHRDRSGRTADRTADP